MYRKNLHTCGNEIKMDEKLDEKFCHENKEKTLKNEFSRN